MRVAFLTTDSREHYRDYENPMPYFGTAPEALLEGFRELESVEVHVISCARSPMQSPTKLGANLWYHGVFVPKWGWMRTAYLGCIRAVRKTLRALRPDIVHGQGTERDCAISALFSGFPSVVTIHGHMRRIATIRHSRPFTFQWLAARLEAFVIPRVDGVVCITEYTRDTINREARRAWVIPNAVDPEFFSIQAEPVEKRTILCIGTICFHKNQNRLILALDPLARQHEFELSFFGGTDRDAAYSKEFFDLVAGRPWCRYGGFLDRARLKAALRTASLLVLPSLEDNCPMVVLEAMAAGVPVVAAKVGGVPDLIEDGVNGLLCSPVEPTSMRQAVARLLTCPSLATHLASGAKRRARDRFWPVEIARQHVAVYRDVLASDS